MIIAPMLLIENDLDKGAALAFFDAFMCSILNRFLMATSAVSLTNFWSATSSRWPFGGLGGFGCLLELVKVHFSCAYIPSKKGIFSLLFSFKLSSTSLPCLKLLPQESTPNSPFDEASNIRTPPKALLRCFFFCEFSGESSLKVVPLLSRSTSASVNFEFRESMPQS